MTWRRMWAYRPRPLTWLRVHLLAPRVVTFPDRVPMILALVIATGLGALALHQVAAGDEARGRRACDSYASDVASARADLQLYGAVTRLDLNTSQRRAVNAAIKGKSASIAAKLELERDLGCPRPSSEDARNAP